MSPRRDGPGALSMEVSVTIEYGVHPYILEAFPTGSLGQAS
jgi:hypothetical protein